MTADRIPVADFPFRPGRGVRVLGRKLADGRWVQGESRVVASRDGFAFLACCQAHADAGRWDGGRWPASAEVRCAARAAVISACQRLIPPSEVTSALGTSPNTAVRWADRQVEAGRLTAYRTAGGHRRFDVDEIAELIVSAVKEATASGRARNEDAEMTVTVIRVLLSGSEDLARAIAGRYGAEALQTAARAGERLAAVCREIGEDRDRRRLRAWRLLGEAVDA